MVVLVRWHRRAVGAAVRRVVDDEVPGAIEEETGLAAVRRVPPGLLDAIEFLALFDRPPGVSPIQLGCNQRGQGQVCATSCGASSATSCATSFTCLSFTWRRRADLAPPKPKRAKYFIITFLERAIDLISSELELELIHSHMAQKPVLRGEVGCACVSSGCE